MAKHIENAGIDAERVGPGWEKIIISDTDTGHVVLTAEVSVDDLRALVVGWISDGAL